MAQASGKKQFGVGNLVPDFGPRETQEVSEPFLVERIVRCYAQNASAGGNSSVAVDNVKVDADGQHRLAGEDLLQCAPLLLLNREHHVGVSKPARFLIWFDV